MPGAPRIPWPPAACIAIISHPWACCSGVRMVIASRRSARPCSRILSNCARMAGDGSSRTSVPDARAASCARRSESMLAIIVLRRSAVRRAIAASRVTWPSVNLNSPVCASSMLAASMDGGPMGGPIGASIGGPFGARLSGGGPGALPGACADIAGAMTSAVANVNAEMSRDITSSPAALPCRPAPRRPLWGRYSRTPARCCARRH